MRKKHMHSFQKEQKHKVAVISVKKKVITLNLIQQKRKKLLEEGMKEQGWSTLPEVTLKFTTDTQHKKSSRSNARNV